MPMYAKGTPPVRTTPFRPCTVELRSGTNPPVDKTPEVAVLRGDRNSVEVLATKRGQRSLRQLSGVARVSLKKA